MSLWCCAIDVADRSRRDAHNPHFMTKNPLSPLKYNVFSPYLSSGTAWASTNCPESVFGRAQPMCNINLCLSSGASVGHAIGTDLCPQSLITDIEQHSTFSQIIVLCFLNTLASHRDRFTCAVWLSLPIVESIICTIHDFTSCM